MISRFLVYKNKAILLRKRGKSIGEIERITMVPRSTLSGWFRGINLTEEQIIKIREHWLLSLAKSRETAAEVHRQGKRKRLEIGEAEAKRILTGIDLKDKNILKLAFSALFFGEGFKKAGYTGFGNSDVLCVKVFVKFLMNLYDFNLGKLKLYLHLRADQNPDTEIIFWSRELNIDSSHFKIAPVDERTIGKPTYANYHGVCIVCYYDVSIKREMLFLARLFFEEISKMDA